MTAATGPLDPANHEDPDTGDGVDPDVVDAVPSGTPGPHRYDLPHLHAAREAVPQAGTRWTRWYDGPFKVLTFLTTGWRRRLLPRPVRVALARGLSRLYAYNELDRYRAWNPHDPLHTLRVPDGEHVDLPAIWLVEFFGPSVVDHLDHALHRGSWKRPMIAYDGENPTILKDARAGTGWTWWRIGSAQSPDSRWLLPDAVRTNLPAQFDNIQLRGVQIGTGLTAVIAQFTLSPQGRRHLDTIWHAPHEPRLACGDGPPRPLDRLWAGYDDTQRAREALHATARRWMTKQFPGIFAQSGEAHTLVDMMLFDTWNPADRDQSRGLSDPLRALGLTRLHESYTSADLPGFHLQRAEPRMAKALSSDRTWSLVAQRAVAADHAAHLDVYGARGEATSEQIGHALSARYDEYIHELLLALGPLDVLRSIERRHSLARDRARVQHGRFAPRRITHLRELILTSSLDLSAIRRSLEHDAAARGTFGRPPQFIWTDDDAPAGVTPHEPINLNTLLTNRQKSMLSELVQADREYREVVSAVAALGASIDTARTGHKALFTALVSLAVAAITLLVTTPGNDTMATRIVGIGQQLFEHISR